ncbi:hypothetical protein HPB47_000560 [Ixodes persulcatus]|uniref:Uncharacterized protein n=1 Tax=Ixodes persulcatus TaxID=34615 RepID=A0AC60PRL2_IXOPE|nr:hypothetical protein HPB47_000560 [Ixodes persulcatus]
MTSVNMEKEGLLRQLEFFKEKGVKKKLTAASKRAGCQDLQIWIQTATNHMYWSARAAGGDKKLLIDIWLSMHNHVINKHLGHEGTYGRCLHGDICQSQHDHRWIPAYNQFKSITGNKRLLKDLAQMSPHGQTYALEAFHSVLIDFAPKSQAFSPEGMLASKQWRSLAAASKANTVVFPAPMTAAYTRPPKEELVAARLSRFGQSPQ